MTPLVHRCGVKVLGQGSVYCGLPKLSQHRIVSGLGDEVAVPDLLLVDGSALPSTENIIADDNAAFDVFDVSAIDVQDFPTRSRMRARMPLAHGCFGPQTRALSARPSRRMCQNGDTRASGIVGQKFASGRQPAKLPPACLTVSA